MRKLIFFSLLLSIWSCQGSDDDIPPPSNNQPPTDLDAFFRIRYEQSGDIEGFERTFQCDTDSATDQDFVWYDTKLESPSYFTGDDLLAEKYEIETKVPVEELRPLVDVNWNNARALSPGWQGPDQIKIELTVWRNDTIVGNSVVQLTSDAPPATVSIDSLYKSRP